MESTSRPDAPQALADAGCTQSQIDAYEQLRAHGDMEGCMRLLRQQRSVLVRQVHEAQRPLDVLDYIMYHMQRKGI